jgi:ABC-type branched-subunit amino acid transport system ATPase component
MLSISGIVAGYGQGDILRGVDLELEERTITCIVGPNGAGKSTVLRTLSGLLHPKRGTIVLDGRSLVGLSPRAVLEAGVVHVPQERSLFPLMTVWENVVLGGYILGDRGLARRRAEEIADRFPLVKERRSERAGSLSGGQQKIVEIARALMLEPKLILMDEPSMGLDPKARRIVFETVTHLNRDIGHTVLLVEQNARAGLQISHRAVVMDTGLVALDGRADRMLEDPKVAQLYLGGRVAGSPADGQPAGGAAVEPRTTSSV